MYDQIHFASVDLELHSRFIPGGSTTIFDVDCKIAEKTQILPPLPEGRFLCGFSHIFAGSYLLRQALLFSGNIFSNCN